MATDSPDILEQALAEVGPYIGLDAGSEVNPYSSTDTGSQVNPYISSQTDNIVQDVQALCTRLAEEGEETLFISVNVSGNQCAYLGSTFGKDYIEKNGLVQGFFSYCDERYESRQSNTPVKPAQTVVPQESGHTISQASRQTSNNVTSTPTLSQTPVSLPVSTTAYRSLLTKAGIQELAQRSLNEGNQNEQTSILTTGSSASMVTGIAEPPVSMATGIAEPPVSMATGITEAPISIGTGIAEPPASIGTVIAGPSVSTTTGSAGSLAATVTGTGTSLDKSIGTDFPDDDDVTVPITKSFPQNKQKGGAGEKYVVYIQKSPDSNSEKSVLVYKRPEDLQKDTLKKLGLVKSDEEPKDTEKNGVEIIKSATVMKDPDELSKPREDAGTVRKRGRPPRTVVSAQPVTSDTAKVTNQAASHTETSDRTASQHSPGRVTRKRAIGESNSTQSPLGSTRRQAIDISTPQLTGEADTKGPFHMRTRSGGKAKRMPWLNKWKDNDDDEDDNEKRKPKERKTVASPEQQIRSGNKRKESVCVDGVRKRIKIETESDDEDPVETQEIDLVSREQSGGSKREADRAMSFQHATSSKQLENEQTINDESSKDNVSETQHPLASNDKSVDIAAGGDSAEYVHQTGINMDENVDETLTDNIGSGEGVAAIGSDDARTECDKCEMCGDEFETAKALILHMEEDHDIRTLREEEDEEEDGLDKELKGEDIHQCHVCQKVFSTLLRLKLHKKVHSSGQYVCSVCGKCYLQERILLRHINQMHRKKHFPCTECQDIFKSQRQRDEHLAIKHNLPSVSRCKHCKETFPDARALRTHSKYHVTPCICEFCGKAFPRRADLVMHRRIHTKEKPIKCHICGRGFARASTLLSHKLTHRTYNAFQCEVCGRTFKTKESMRQHRKVHTKESTVPCEHCELKFRTFDGMKNHVIQGHTDITPPKKWNVYTCDKCPKKFGGRQQYIRHMSVHTGVRPFDCNLCGKSYPTQGALNTHKKIHKECMPERQFHCNVCNLHFGIVSKMKRHMETAKHIQYCMAVGVDPMGNLREYEAKVSAEGNLRAHLGGVQVPADGSMPIVIKNEIPELAEYEGDETVECVLIHLPDDEVALQDGAQIVYSINTEDGTIESVFHESAPTHEVVATVETQ